MKRIILLIFLITAPSMSLAQDKTNEDLEKCSYFLSKVSQFLSEWSNHCVERFPIEKDARFFGGYHLCKRAFWSQVLNKVNVPQSCKNLQVNVHDPLIGLYIGSYGR